MPRGGTIPAETSAVPFIREFVTLNRGLFLFAYGLIFFILGLAIALQSRRYSRLELARSLSWLAAFGLTHGLQEWGDLFIPIQATYMSRPGIVGLTVLQLLLLGGSFACLLQFGVALLRPAGRARWLHGLSAGVFVAWLFVIFFVLLPLQPDLTTWQHTANALARYFIGFPAGLLAAFGLRRQALDRIAPLNVPHIVNTLRIGGLALAFYALLAGLIPPAVPFWPGNLLNTTTFEEAFSVPPLVFRSLIGLVLAIAIIRALEVFEVETARLIEAMEQQQILAAERDRLGRNLHDGAIQTVYTAGLLVESARHLVADDSPAAPRLEKALAVLNDAISDLRQSLGELRGAPSGNTSQPLDQALRQLTADPSFSSLLDINLALNLPRGETLSAVRADHVLAIVREALANAVRHARASRVSLTASRSDGRLLIIIKDNGIGLPPDGRAGYGLRNMRDRARLLDGTVEIMGAPGKGVTVELNVPWEDES